VPPVPSTRPRVRWGLWDVVFAWIAGLFGALVASALVVDQTRPVRLIVVLVGQNAAIIAYLYVIARQKGLGSLRRDFGFTLRAGDISWFFTGIGIQLLSFVPTTVLIAIHGSEAKQDVVKIADKAHGIQIPLMILGVAVLAPVTEELLYRGVLLRGLLRRMDAPRAVFLSALIFGLVHAIGDPSLGTLIAIPSIMLLGVVSAYQAAQTGDLSRSIMLHMGFNALTVVFLFT
jgi:membrane protease YdiL (CAAX protease family)